MIIRSPGDIAFSLFGFPVYWYGIILACAVLIGVFTAEIISKRYCKDIPKNFFVDISPYLIILGILGARLYYCALNFGYYLSNPLEIFNIRQGGLSIHGMIITGVIAAAFIAERRKINFLKLLDILACSTILAQAAGRWGNFFNSEAFGIPTNADWGLFIPFAARPAEYMSYELFHPAFLYESVLDVVIFCILFAILRKHPKNGTVFFTYLLLYSLARIFTEQIRIDSALNIHGYPIALFVSIFVVILSILGFVVRYSGLYDRK